MLIKYKRYEFKRKWQHPKFANSSLTHTFKISNGDEFIVNTIEDINILKFDSRFELQILTLQEANDLLVSWNHAQSINENLTIGENESHVEVKKWTKKKFRMKFSFEERFRFENYEYFIDTQDITDDEKAIRKMQMKTLMRDFEEHDKFWNTDQNLKEMLLFLESINFIEAGKTDLLLS